MKQVHFLLFFSAFILFACNQKQGNESKNISQEKLTIMTLDPGHFHAALVQKTSNEQINDSVFVYGPAEVDIKNHLKRIEGYNNRDNNPTNWNEIVYEGDDYLEKMIAEKPGNVMIVSGKNNKKIDYMTAAVDAGIHVYADKPMVINSEGFQKLEQLFKTAKNKDILVYDIMTERFENTTILQRMLSMDSNVFGTLIEGTEEQPAITKESVHHFFKYVSGNPLKRPDWFFDTEQRGEGLIDVSTHLVDLVQWEAFPNQILKKSDIEIVNAKHWTTQLSKPMFKKVTGADSFPTFLQKDVKNDTLNVYCNGATTYKIKGKYAKTSVIWNFQAPEGTGDTHYSIMRGTKCNLIIKQGPEEGYKPKLHIEIEDESNSKELEEVLNTSILTNIETAYPGINIEQINNTTWALDIPNKYKIGHEAHFEQVTKNFLKYYNDPSTVPAWEIPNMIVKYYTTTQALEFVNNQK